MSWGGLEENFDMAARCGATKEYRKEGLLQRHVCNLNAGHPGLHKCQSCSSRFKARSPHEVGY